MSDTGNPLEDLQDLEPSQAQPEVVINANNALLRAFGEDAGGSISVKQVGDSPSGNSVNVREIRFDGATVTPQTNGVALITITPSSDTGGGASSDTGESLEVTDGTTIISSARSIRFPSGTLSEGSDSEAIYTPATGGGGGGGGGSSNITPDTHPTSGNAMDEEGEGTSLDPKWSWVNQGAAAVSFANGCLVMTVDPAASGDDNNILVQAISGSPWAFTMKFCVHGGNNGNGSFGLIAYNSGSGKGTKLGIYNPSGSFSGIVQQLNSPTSYNANTWINALAIPNVAFTGQESSWIYGRLLCDGTSLYYLVSLTGVEDTFVQVYTETLASFLSSVTHVGLVVNRAGSSGGTTPSMLVDWFRRTT